MLFNENQINLISNEISYNILNAKLKTYPFPHSEISEIFPYSLIKELETHFPAKNEFIPITKSANKTVVTSKKSPYDFRYQISLTKGDEIATSGGLLGKIKG